MSDIARSVRYVRMEPTVMMSLSTWRQEVSVDVSPCRGSEPVMKHVPIICETKSVDLISFIQKSV